MQAFAVRRFGEQPALHDLPKPDAEGAFLIRVVCAAVNPLDYKLLDRLTAESRYPFVVGVDFAGVIERVPAAAGALHPGDRVFGIARTHGAYAEFTAVAPGVPTEPLARIPDAVTDEQAAVLPIPGITALQAIEMLETSSGQRIVVIGANGAVGGFAVQIARARGAHVIAAVRGNPEEALGLGAHEVHDSADRDALEAIRAAHPGGVDAVLDMVNGSPAIRRAAEILRAGGRLVSTVYAADESWFAERQIIAYNIASNTNPLSSPAGLHQLARLVEEGAITARVGPVFSLSDASTVLARARSGNLGGKAIIRP